MSAKQTCCNKRQMTEYVHKVIVGLVLSKNNREQRRMEGGIVFIIPRTVAHQRLVRYLKCPVAKDHHWHVDVASGHTCFMRNLEGKGDFAKDWL